MGEKQEVQKIANGIQMAIQAIPSSLRKEVAQYIIHQEHRTNQQLVFSNFIGPLVGSYASISRSEARQYVDGRNEATYDWCCKAVTNNNETIFPYI